MKPYKNETKPEEVMAQTEAEDQYIDNALDDTLKGLDMLKNDANALELADQLKQLTDPIFPTSEEAAAVRAQADITDPDAVKDEQFDSFQSLMKNKQELEQNSDNDFLSSFSGEMITSNKTQQQNTSLDDDIQETLNKNKLMNIEIIKDQNKTEYDRKM